MPKRKVSKPVNTLSSEEEWEDVEDKTDFSNKDVKVELDFSKILKKQQATKQDKMRGWILMFINRAINKSKKDIQVYMHKTHLLCLLSMSMRLNKVSNDMELQGLVLSILPPCFAKLSFHEILQENIVRIVKWTSENFELKYKVLEQKIDAQSILLKKLHLKKAINNHVITQQIDFVLILLIIFRSLGLCSRFVISLQPLPLRSLTDKQKEHQSANQLRFKRVKPESAAYKTGKSQKSNKVSVTKEKKIPQLDGANDTNNISPRVTRSKTNATQNTSRKHDANTKKRQEFTKILKNKNIKLLKQRAVKSSDVGVISMYGFASGNNLDSDDTHLLAARQVSKLAKSRKDAKSNLTSKYKKTNAAENGNAKRLSKRKCVKQATTNPKNCDSSTDDDYSASESSDDDFVISNKNTLKRHVPKRSKLTTAISKPIPGVKTPSAGNAKLNQSINQWIEVYIEKVGWICVDVISGIVDQPNVIEMNATKPLCYALAFDNQNCVKDVTPRYASNWLTTTRKLRVGSVDKSWWKNTLQLYGPKNQGMNEQENKQLETNLLSQPLPTTISAYKDHPLFALRRHLLKYESIYPHDIPAIGLVRGEEVLPRSSVHVLHTREKWLQSAVSVKDGEEPYKMVSSWLLNKKLNREADALSQPLFGKWQTEPYQPPVAENGLVPRNQFGNVDIFQPSMLPIGCIQMRLPNLTLVARKLNIDIATAIVGFDTHHGFPHPVTDGYVVCKEHETVLREAWEEEQAHIEEIEKQKREKRVYSRWKTFIRGMFALTKVQQKYSNKNQNEQGHVLSEKIREVSEPWQAKRLREIKKKSNKITRRGAKRKKYDGFPFEVETM